MKHMFITWSVRVPSGSCSARDAMEVKVVAASCSITRPVVLAVSSIAAGAALVPDAVECSAEAVRSPPEKADVVASVGWYVAAQRRLFFSSRRFGVADNSKGLLVISCTGVAAPRQVAGSGAPLLSSVVDNSIRSFDHL